MVLAQVDLVVFVVAVVEVQVFVQPESCWLSEPVNIDAAGCDVAAVTLEGATDSEQEEAVRELTLHSVWVHVQ